MVYSNGAHLERFVSKSVFVVIGMVSYALRPVEIFNQHATCECGGEFKSDGSVFPAHPPRYQHVCEICGKIETLQHAHPRTIHVEQHHSGKGYHVEIVMSSEHCATLERIGNDRGGVIKLTNRDVHGELVYTADGECTLLLTVGYKFMNYGLSVLRGRVVNTITFSDEARAWLGEENFSQILAQLEHHKRRS